MIDLIQGIIIFFIFLRGVPYINQQSPEWNLANDCGPAAAQMIITYYTGEIYHPHAYYNEMNITKGSRQNDQNILAWMEDKDVPGSIKDDWTMQELTETLMKGIPILITLQEPLPVWGHMLIVIGISDRYVYAHDPWTRAADAIPLEDFIEMWAFPGSWRSNMAIVPDYSPEEMRRAAILQEEAKLFRLLEWEYSNE